MSYLCNCSVSWVESNTLLYGKLIMSLSRDPTLNGCFLLKGIRNNRNSVANCHSFYHFIVTVRRNFCNWFNIHSSHWTQKLRVLKSLQKKMAKPALTESLTLNNGQKMPLLGLGTWKSKPGEVAEAVYQAIKAGYRHIDGAYFYLNETEVGQGLHRAMKEFNIKR